MNQLSDLNGQLTNCGQSHLVDYLSMVTPETARNSILSQLNKIDFDDLAIMIDKYVHHYCTAPSPSSVKPAQYYSLEGPWDRSDYQTKGEELIRGSKVACFTVAGGQGSRLGYEGPKGCYPTSCISQKPLFQIFAEGILKSQQKYAAVIPWYIMTSPLNHLATKEFFAEHAYFGLDEEHVMFFEQGVMPSLDAKTGEILMADPMHLATNPDGHGGAFKALSVSGALADMKSRGIEHMSYFQVDNPLTMVIDPVFLGLHAFTADSSGEFSSKMVAKSSWDEKVGVFCDVDGSTEIIEYSDMADELAQQTDDDGQLSFNAGSIAIHAIGVEFIDKITSNPAYALPFHRAMKKVSHFDLATGRTTNPDENNAVKLEKFVFDGIPLASSSIVVETDRIEEFAPVKNATGNDSIESSKLLQSERAAKWLEAAGVNVARKADGTVDATIEISGLTAVCSDDLQGIELPDSIGAGATVSL